MTIRWLTDEEVLGIVNPACAQRGWAQQNTGMCRVLGAFYESGELIEFFVLQVYPMLGPLLRLDNINVDGGTVTRELTKRMEEYLIETNARGYMTIADSPLTERLCLRFGMTRVESPVFTKGG